MTRPPTDFARLAGPVGAYAYVLTFALPLTTDYSLAALALCALVASFGARKATRPGSFTGLSVSIACFCMVSVASAVLSLRPWSSLASMVSLVPALLLFMLVSHDFSSPRQIRFLFLSLSIVALGSSSALVAIALTHPGNDPGAWVGMLASPVVVVPNDAAFFAVLVPVFLSLVLERPRRTAAAVGALATASTLLASMLLQSRTAIITCLVCLIATAVLRRDRSLLVISIATPIIVAIADAALHAQLLAKFATRVTDARPSLWLSGWKMFLDHPILGHGPNSFGVTYPQYMGRLDLPAWAPIDPRVVAWPHSLYVELLAERGLLGTAAFAFVLGCAALLASQVRKSGDRELRSVANTSAACLTGLLFASLIELTFLRLWVVVLLFVLLGVIDFASRRTLRTIATSAKEMGHDHA